MKRLASYLIAAIGLVLGPDAYATAIQTQDPATIFARACATCHGAKGLGGVSWVKNDPKDQRIAPRIAGDTVDTIKAMVRRGSDSASMPGFGVQEITDAELDALATFISNNPNGVPTPPPGMSPASPTWATTRTMPGQATQRRGM